MKEAFPYLKEIKRPLNPKYSYTGQLYVNGKRGSKVDYQYNNIPEVKKQLKKNFKKY